MLHRDFYAKKNIIIKGDSIIFVDGGKIIEKEWNTNLNKLRQELKHIGFHKPYNNDTYGLYYSDRLERYGLPYMNYIYYYCLFKNLRIPSLSEFITEYIKTYCNELDDGMLEVKHELNNEILKFTKEQLIGRVFRSYNSFHREIDLLMQFKEHGFDVEYDLHKDLDGIDLTVKYQQKEIYIASYVATRHSQNWKTIKNDMRHDYNDKIMIDIIARMKEPDMNCFCLNGIYVYDKFFINQTITKIKKKVR